MKTKTGFTLIELMMVVLVMAILATLAIGAVLKSKKQPQDARIKATCMALSMGLTNYRAAEQRWPLTLAPESGSNIVVIREDNARVFAPLLKDSNKYFFDVSALMTKVPGKGVMPLREAMKQKIPPEACPLGYPDPANRDIFKYFKVTFNLSLDTVSVEQ
jgi:prepilin-type N-terminal cleavage/methylation domain-containing protein